MLMRWWTWLTTCAEAGCALRPVHLGWCDRHAPAYHPGPDEYWGDLHPGTDDDPSGRAGLDVMPRCPADGCRRTASAAR
jgi:hypothetical protein